MEVNKLCKHGVFEDISFKIHEGEVIGFSGLVGAGRTEIARCIFGLDPYDSGEIILNGINKYFKNPIDALNAGIAYVTEDRKNEGFIPFMSIKHNLALPSYDNISKYGFINTKEESAISKKYFDILKIKADNDEKDVIELSGGNQQKVSLGKWLALNPKVLILDEPTRGIDVGTKFEIHNIISMLAMSGIAILFISSEMQEIIGVSDSIVVLRGGKISAILDPKSVTQDDIMRKSAYTTA